MPSGIDRFGGSAMLEKLLLAAALTLSLQIFAGVSTASNLPKNIVLRSIDLPARALKLPLVSVPAGFEPKVES
ncbi:hypothetical protein [Tychonema sp. LEGE 07203]|uniref:hypothetical protein n=1 Tax=Tychonema sp. LEGE 07203 TaxID=1828671 RepID=UPI001D158C32|nr:hypothetical protein [Tychonema sp. LEGE 07203]